MAYWWVNHKQTFKKEFEGGYIWSPKVNKNGSRNQSYVNLTLANAGDIIFSYANAHIRTVGVIEGKYQEASVPDEFGNTGAQWNNDGFLVKVNWEPLLEQPLKPKEHIEQIRALLPTKYSPIQQSGDGNQGIYLAAISNELGSLIVTLLDKDNPYISTVINEAEKRLNEEEEERFIKNANIPDPEKEQLIKARTGQGVFKSNLMEIEKSCRLTGVNDPTFLIASHIKPWAESTKEEKLDGNNGLLLSPHVDKLFDRGWISFSDDGDILVKDNAREVFDVWKLDMKNVGRFNKKQQAYLAYHRKKFNITKKSIYNG